MYIFSIICTEKNYINLPTPVSALLHAATMVIKVAIKIRKYFIIILLYAGKTLNLKFIYTFELLTVIHQEIYKKIFNWIKPKVNQQETIKMGSSETECEITFQFYEYNKIKSEHIPNINQSFLEWLIGFTEGDGSFVISKNKVYFDITQNLEDIQVLYYIKKNLGFGKILIRNEPHRNVGVFYVTSEINFFKLITIFNGNLCSNYKKNQFKNWLNVFNNQYKKDIIFIDRIIKPSFYTGWLSGFIDAEGSFTGRLKSCKTSKLKKAPHLTLSISQKEFYILNLIKELFSPLKFNNIRYDKSWDGWQFHISSFKKLKFIKIYLNNFPLKTKKHIRFLKWSHIHDKIMNKEHLTQDGLNILNILYEKLKS